MSGQKLAGRRVLVVEDDYVLAEYLAEVIGSAGAEVIGPVGSVRDALEALAASPDVACLDVRLGDETSFPIADELARRGVPFLFATGSAKEIPVAHGERTVCLKPVGNVALVQGLVKALSG